MKILIFTQKVGNFWEITILRSPETLVLPVVYLSFFNVSCPFSRYPAHFTKICGIPLFLAFRVPRSDFWPRIGLLGARLRNLYKRKLLGGFLEARDRKSAFWTRKVGNFTPEPDFRRKSVFRAKSWNFAKLGKCSRNLTISALKSCSEIPILLFLEPFC